MTSLSLFKKKEEGVGGMEWNGLATKGRRKEERESSHGEGERERERERGSVFPQL